MKCEDIKKLLAAFQDGQVTDRERVQIQAHIDDCDDCKQELLALADMQKKLSVAFTVKAQRAEPFTDSWNRLRQKLVLEPRRSFFGSLSNLLAQPAWRVAAAAAVVFLIGIGVVFATGILPGKSQPANFSAVTSTGGVQSPTVPGVAAAPPSAESNQPATRDSNGASSGEGQGKTAAPSGLPTPVPTPVPSLTIPQIPPSLVVKWTASTDAYKFGQKVDAKMTVTNTSTTPQAIQGFPPLIEIVKSGLPPETVVRSFPASNQQVVLDPGKSIEYALTWDQRDNAGQQVTYGRYEIRPSIAGAYPNTLFSSSSFNLVILPAEGAMEKKIEVSKSVTINDITVTLEWIGFEGQNQTQIYALVNYPPGGMPTTVMFPIKSIEYSFDNGILRKVGVNATGYNTIGNGFEQSWHDLDPAPKNAKELLIRIPQIGDKQGPWEFRVSLQ